MRQNHKNLRILFFALCLSAVLMLTGCFNKLDSGITQSSDPQNTIDQVDTFGGVHIIEDTPYFRITEENGLYAYTIYSQNGDAVKYEDKLMSQPDISLLDDNLIKVIIRAGTGIGAQSGFYYDISYNRFSDVYQSILDQHGEFVVYATEKTIIVTDIFGDKACWLELSSFSNPFSDAAFPFISATFSNDGSQIYVTYLTGENYEEVSETFEIGMLNNSCFFSNVK